MGEDKAVVCRDCDEYVRVHKTNLPPVDMNGHYYFDEVVVQDIIGALLSFLSHHRGHEVSLLGEYGRHQDEFFQRMIEDEEFEYGGP